MNKSIKNLEKTRNYLVANHHASTREQRELVYRLAHEIINVVSARRCVDELPYPVYEEYELNNYLDGINDYLARKIASHT